MAPPATLPVKSAWLRPPQFDKSQVAQNTIIIGGNKLRQGQETLSTLLLRAHRRLYEWPALAVEGVAQVGALPCSCLIAGTEASTQG